MNDADITAVPSPWLWAELARRGEALAMATGPAPLAVVCPGCGVERADYEGPGLHLAACPNCGATSTPAAPAVEAPAPKTVRCPECGGSGRINDDGYRARSCGVCAGSGEVDGCPECGYRCYEHSLDWAVGREREDMMRGVLGVGGFNGDAIARIWKRTADDLAERLAADPSPEEIEAAATALFEWDWSYMDLYRDDDARRDLASTMLLAARAVQHQEAK